MTVVIQQSLPRSSQASKEMYYYDSACIQATLYKRFRKGYNLKLNKKSPEMWHKTFQIGRIKCPNSEDGSMQW